MNPLPRLIRLHGSSCEAAEGDDELLARFAATGDVAAFEGLLNRYGPMVYSTCRRRLAASADAEDAFQATFLALVCHARTIRRALGLGGWLHQTSVRVAGRRDPLIEPFAQADFAIDADSYFVYLGGHAWSAAKLSGGMELNYRLDASATSDDAYYRLFGAGSGHVGGANFAFADGSIRFISNGINASPTTLPALSTRAGGEVVDSSAY